MLDCHNDLTRGALDRQLAAQLDEADPSSFSRRGALKPLKSIGEI